MMKINFKRFLAVVLTVCTLFLACAVPIFAAEPEELLYDVTTSGIYADFQYLFDPPIDISKYRRSGSFNEDHDYIEIVGFYSDVVFSEWGNYNSYQSGADYLYIYCPTFSGEVLGGSIATDTRLVALLPCSQFWPFIKFKLDAPYRVFDDQTATASIPVESISVRYRSIFDGDDSHTLRAAPSGVSHSNTYSFKDFSIDLSYKDQSDSELNKVEFNGSQVLDLDVGYTYWRSANSPADKSAGWHYQVDSIYFSIPNAIQDRLVDVELSYQQATTKPIVVTKTGEHIGETFISDWFRNTALDPENSLIEWPGTVRYEMGKPYFQVHKRNIGGKYTTWEYGYNVRQPAPAGSQSLFSVYWAFDVEDPSDISSGSLNSGELSSPKATVSADQLEEWMLSYPLDGATTTYTAASRDGTRTQQVNGILFSNVQERVTKNASSIAGTSLPFYGDEHNFFENLAVFGWNYAWSYLTGAARKDNDGNAIPIDTLKTVIHPLHSYNDITDNSDVLHFSASDEANLKTALSRANGNGETLYLVNFNVSDYYAYSFSEAKFRENHERFGTEKDFDGYLSIQDLYLDLRVLKVFFQNAQGDVYPVDVRHKPFNGISDSTPAPEEEQMEEAAKEALKVWASNGFSSFWEELLDLLRKIATVLLIILAVVLVLKIVSWILMMRRTKPYNTGQAQAPGRERPRRQERPYRQYRPYRERSRRPDRRRWKR